MNNVTRIGAIEFSAKDLRTRAHGRNRVLETKQGIAHTQSDDHPPQRAPSEASRSIGTKEIDRADLYSAAMGVSEMARLVTQNPDPPPIANVDAPIQIPWRLTDFSPHRSQGYYHRFTNHRS